MQLKLSSINIIHVNQEHNVDFFIFKFTQKCMLGSVYINKIHEHVVNLFVVNLIYMPINR